MRMRLSLAAAVAEGRLIGDDVMVSGFALDSRSVQAGELFVALPGKRVDGHEFVEQAAERGAGAALVQRALPIRLPQIVVAQVAEALAAIARAWREQLSVAMVGITGSNGKTTVKEMVASILTRVGPTLSTRGNYNNELGVPLTLGRLEADHRFAVLEMGCGQAGDIHHLAGLTQPQVGVVTNAGPAHLERLGSIEGVARTKGELFQALPHDGVAVINADDPFADFWRGLAGHCRYLSFGTDAAASVSAPASPGSALVMETPVGRIETELALPGEHNRLNALAATAAALALEIDPADISAGLASLESLPGRLELHQSVGGWALFDDTYNANPASLYAGLKVIQQHEGEAWLVLGDMAELGGNSGKLHAEMGQAAADLGVTRLFTVGQDSAAASLAFGRGGSHFSDHEALIPALLSALHPDVVCLVKGSRSSAMERVVDALIGGQG